MLHKSCAKSLLLFFRLPPGYPRKKAARFFMPDGFLRNVIAQIIFFCGCRLRKALILQCSYSITIEDGEFSGLFPVADVGDLSPYSSTSVNWDDKWPIKPEILLDGGNIATNGTDYSNCPDLSLLTTNRLPLVRLFSTIWGTSSATAQAAWMAAQLFAEYPGIWPETVRALLVHSSRWTDEMRRRFCTNKLKSQGIRNLLRSCGYGIPHLEKAIQCLNNSVNMIIQGEIQPYEKSEGSARTREMHLHTIPWPVEVLQSLGETEVELRVTLSYFVEPGPGEIGWKNRYRYPSHGLRFDLINTNQTVEDFKKRINVKMRGDDPKDKGDGSSGGSRWFLGSENRDVGSIHSDFIKTSAVNLCNANVIAVYPVIGWWRERSYLGKCDSTARYRSTLRAFLLFTIGQSYCGLKFGRKCCKLTIDNT